MLVTFCPENNSEGKDNATALKLLALLFYQASKNSEEPCFLKIIRY